ncbi:EamA family transporter [Aestuariivirga litoralis]|uniref:EamA family transporter n=1 Tax=Aestuariivirga litoralis TaxID=2650924 RepID=UPI0018C63E6C|nr:EamA family transporter [Aestuariivirga litoralis]MBG1232901.1 EamA family transporter [Aestuariivirga litoralis]
MALLLGLFAALCWGVHDLAVRFLAPRMGGFRLGLRTELGGFIILLPLVLAVRNGTMHDWLLVAVLGVVYGLAIAGLFKSFAMAPLSVVGPFSSGYPALVVIWGMFFGLSPSLLQYFGMATILIGSAVVARYSHDGSGIHTVIKGHVWELAFWIVLSDICFAIAIVLGQKLALTFGDATTAGLLRVPAMLILGSFALREPASTIKMTWKIALACVILGGLDVAALTGVNAMGTLPYKEFGAMGIAAYGAIAALLGMIWLKEKVSLGQWAGIALTIAGVAALGVQFE